MDSPGQVWGSLLWDHCSFFLGPGVHKVLSVPCKCLFPQSCVSSVIKSHWSSKSNFLGVLSVFVRFPQVGEFLWALELLQQCENFFDIIVLQFEGHLLGGSTVGLMANSCKRIYATRHASHVCQSPCPLSPRQAAADLCFHRDSRTLKGRSPSVFCGVSGFWCTQGFV